MQFSLLLILPWRNLIRSVIPPLSLCIFSYYKFASEFLCGLKDAAAIFHSRVRPLLTSLSLRRKIGLQNSAALSILKTNNVD
jgi:hypothetical protein